MWLLDSLCVCIHSKIDIQQPLEGVLFDRPISSKICFFCGTGEISPSSNAFTKVLGRARCKWRSSTNRSHGLFVRNSLDNIIFAPFQALKQPFHKHTFNFSLDLGKNVLPNDNVNPMWIRNWEHHTPCQNNDICENKVRIFDRFYFEFYTGDYNHLYKCLMDLHDINLSQPFLFGNRDWQEIPERLPIHT